MSDLPDLSPIEARILGVLIEKERTTPDVYPLTVNSLTSGCNQKTSRAPVMSLAESEVQGSLEGLRRRNLVLETYGASGRVLRYAHNFGKTYGLPGPAVPLLAVLALRGPQTASELRANCERLHGFADASSVEGYLEQLAERPQPLALKLPRQPGAREQRWTHLLCGPVDIQAAAATGGTERNAPAAGLEARVAQLESEVAELRRQLQALLDRDTTDSSTC